MSDNHYAFLEDALQRFSSSLQRGKLTARVATPEAFTDAARHGFNEYTQTARWNAWCDERTATTEIEYGMEALSWYEDAAAAVRCFAAYGCGAVAARFLDGAIDETTVFGIFAVTPGFLMMKSEKIEQAAKA